MTAQERIWEKLGELSGYLSELEDQKDLDLQEFLADVMRRRGIERTLHLAIECLLDVGHQLISLHRWRTPESNRDVFRVLAENGVLPPPLLETAERMASFRNLMVHDYARVDPHVVYGILKKRQGDFHLLAEAIKHFLTTSP